MHLIMMHRSGSAPCNAEAAPRCFVIVPGVADLPAWILGRRHGNASPAGGHVGVGSGDRDLGVASLGVPDDPAEVTGAQWRRGSSPCGVPFPRTARLRGSG